MAGIAALFFIVILFSGCALDSDMPQVSVVPEGPTITRRVITVPTRPAVRQRILIVEAEGESRGTLILFPGGDGAGHFRETGSGFRLSSNFLVRSSDLFAQEGYAAAVVDVPSDRASGMSDGFRTSRQHIEDIRAAIDSLVQIRKGPIFLVGTSRGTLSAAFLATALEDHRVKGIVLTASYDYLESLSLERIRYPVLFVHHRDDACRVSSYAAARRQFGRMTSSPRKDFITISDGDRPTSGPCQALSYHGFLGKEKEAVRAIAQWLAGGIKTGG